MPTRILRDWTDSFAVDELDAAAERFFVRLIMVADDYGRFHADPRLLRSKCFPLKTDIRDTDISRWIAACDDAGLLRCYLDPRGRALLQIEAFGQRTRTPSRFPAPENCQQIAAKDVTSQPLDRGARTNDRKAPPNAGLVGGEGEGGVGDVVEGEVATTGRKRRSLPDAVGWSASDGWSGITEADKAEWRAAYPAVDLDRQLAQMTAWLKANPARARKSNWRRFVVAWLTKSQDRGGDLLSNRPTAQERKAASEYPEPPKNIPIY